MYTLAHLGTVHVLRHPNEHSAQTQLVAVVAMTATHAKKNLNAQKKCKIQVLEKPAQQQNPHKTKTLKNKTFLEMEKKSNKLKRNKR